ncbi:MAG TPA: winged helix DNA-binding domain-containing protein [Streptosporangiaceae bacterium]|nr:winged helix DNA-binding domain-containing protein [Streptosporangiaceae bacterium]
MSPAALQAARFSAQLLTGPPARSAAEVTRRLLAVQAQDPRGARLAIRPRSAGLTAADVDAALTSRSLLISWLNRGTLHLVAAEDYWWLHPLVTPPLRTANARRLEQEGVSPAAADTAVAVIETALASEGPLTRPQLRERIAAAGVRTQGQALVHELMLACLRGIAVRGPMSGGEHAYALVRDWLGPPPPALDRDVALAELARRFLAGHGPATERDLAKWAGLPLRDARRGLSAIAAELAGWPASEPGDAGQPGSEQGLLDLAAARRGAGLPPPRLLGAYDPVLHGWTSREPVLGEHREVVTVNGLFRPFLLVEGRAAGLWSLSGGVITEQRFGPLPGDVAAAVAADAADVRRFLALG